MIKKCLFVILLWIPSQLLAQDLLLFGGTSHDEFLGCFNCSEFSSNSICNQFGTHGSEFSGTSIWNQFSRFGNQFSSSSPWNQFSSSDDIPVLVDRDGRFYGYFTINYFRSNAVDFASVLQDIYDRVDGDLEQVRETICSLQL